MDAAYTRTFTVIIITIKMIIIVVKINVEFTALLLQRETCGICSYDVSVTVHVMTLEP